MQTMAYIRADIELFSVGLDDESKVNDEMSVEFSPLARIRQDPLGASLISDQRTRRESPTNVMAYNRIQRPPTFQTHQNHLARLAHLAF
jgi:hypothetical protein